MPAHRRRARSATDGSTTVRSLQRFTEAALAHLDLDDLLRELLVRLSEILEIDTAAILLLEDDGENLAARAAKGLEEEVSRGFRLPVGAGFAGRVAAGRQPVVIEDLERSEITCVNPLLREKGVRSLLGVPLLVEGELVGVLHVGTLAPRSFSQDEVQLLQIVGDRAALAIEHARLYQAEQAARSAAEAAVSRAERLQRVTEAALAYLDLDDLLRELLVRISEILEVDTTAILLVEDDGETLAARAAKGLEEEVSRGFRLPVGAGFAGRVAASREPVVIEDLERSEIEVLNPLLREKGVRSLLGVPLIVEGELVGVLHVGTLAPRSFSQDDVQLLQIVGDRAALAIEHARLYEQRRVAEVLQDTVLPDELPSMPGIGLAARYLPAVTESAVGGDWYDVVPLRDGRIGFAIGDVVGSGIEAAALMVQLRDALRAYALEGDSPAKVAAKLAVFADLQPPPRMATFIYGILEPETSRLVLVSGGHPPPLLVTPTGEAHFVEPPTGPPLGVEAVPAYRELELSLEPGRTLLLYTDGLIERRGQRFEDGQGQLAEVAAAAPFDPDLLCDHVVTTLLADMQAPDDTALLAVQNASVGEHLAVTVSAHPQELAAIRHLLRRWLAGSKDATTVDVSAITLACSEACANAIEHAYGPGDATFEITAKRGEREVEITISDSGRWRPPRGEDRGRGIVIMRAFMDDVEVLTDASGTTVRMSKSLGAER